MSVPFFSIVIPVYNVEKYLHQCVDSILNQSCKDYEIILVDDGSLDSSGIICDKYSEQHTQIKVIHKKNGGVSDSRNVGIQSAVGKYILFIDADDLIQKDSLLPIKHTIEENHNPDIVCLELSKFADDSNRIVPMNDGVGMEVNLLTGDKLYSYFANLPKFPASPCTKAIKRELFMNNDLFFKIGISSEDLDWAIKVFLAVETVAYCSTQYYLYRQARNGSNSNTMNEKKVYDILETVERWACYSKCMPEGEKRVLVESLSEYSLRLAFLYYDRVSAKKRRIFRNRIKKVAWILGTRKDRASKMMCISYKLFGLSLTSLLLKKYLRVRGF